MGLLARLRRSLSAPQPEEGPRDVRELIGQLAGGVATLKNRLEELEARQVDREIAFTETRDAVLRHLKRLDELTRRTEARKDGTTDERAAARALLMQAKMRAQGGE